MQAYPATAWLFAVTIATVATWVQQRFVVPDAKHLAAQQAALATLDADTARERLAAADAGRRVAEAERNAADRTAYAASPVHVWVERAGILQQLFAELPAQRIPELRLLGPLDWIDIVRRAELDTAEKLRSALSAARARGRQRLVSFLQEALQRCVAARDGELPSDIAALAPFLSPPADASMLERYSLARGGRLGAKDENLIVEKSVSDMILSVSLTGWNLANGPNLLPAPGESELAALERAAAAMGGALSGGDGQEAEQFARSIRELAEKVAAEFGRVFEDMADDDFKGAVKRFMAAHPDAKPTNFGELLPFLNQPGKYIDALRPLIAQLEYMRDHQGALPGDAAQLRPYLARFDPQQAFRAMKIEVTGDGEHGSMTFSIAPK